MGVGNRAGQQGWCAAQCHQRGWQAPSRSGRGVCPRLVEHARKGLANGGTAGDGAEVHGQPSKAGSAVQAPQRQPASSKDSAVWAVIGAMVNSTQKVMAEMKGKNQDQQKKIMESLETELDSKAGVLRNVTNEAGKRQVVQDEEYVLGLLNMHARDWPMEEQLETVQKFMGNSPKLAALYKHHNASQPQARTVQSGR